MAPFSLASLSEAFLVLMNTPLVPPESSGASCDVPLTEMPGSVRQTREGRRQSSTSTNASPESSTSAIDFTDERWSCSGSSNSHMSRASSPALSKDLPPLPLGARRQSRVRFADDVNLEL